MKKYKQAKIGITVLFLALITFGMNDTIARNILGGSKQRDLPVVHAPLRAAISLTSMDVAAENVESGGNTVTQTLTLQAGWNAIYLEVEPVNPSPLINEGTEEDPVWVHEQPPMDAIFAQLACENCLESVWAWNVPFSTQDYIVDPAEGLWDEPGWLHYFPETSSGPDGGSRAFLTNLLALHTNTAYLVKLDDNLAAPLTLKVPGQPQVEKQQWVRDSYNLAGFPVAPGTTPALAVFFGASPITEVRTLTPAGH